MRIESAGTPPSSFMEKLERFIEENRPEGYTVTLTTTQATESEEMDLDESSIADPSESDGKCYYRHVRNESDMTTRTL